VRSLVAAGDEPAARAHVDRCTALFREQLGSPLPAEIEQALRPPASPALSRPAEVEAALEAGRAAIAAGAVDAGLQSLRRAHGVRATITALAQPYVEAGHVAAWVGVGERATGRWLQVGVVAYPGRASRVYVETARAPSPRRYIELTRPVTPGMRVAVVSSRPGWWQAFVDDEAVGAPVRLPGTAGGAPAYATTESWSGARAGCNGFTYRFDDVAFAGGRGTWTATASQAIRAPGARLARSASGFLAAAA
jgi:hypothetical protein